MRFNKLILLLIVVILFFLVGCNDKNSGSILPYAIVINSDSKENIVMIDQDLNIISKHSIGKYIEDIEISDKYLFVVDSGILENPRKDLYKIDLHDLSTTKMELPYSPHQMTISGDIAYISSFDEKKGNGFYLMAINVNKLDVIDTTFIPGMTASLVQSDNGTVYASINTGGPNNYGRFAQILEVKLDENKIITKNILNDQQELPPSYIISFNDLLYGVYPGFSYGPKPLWLNEPEKYTNKLKIIDIDTGKIKSEANLSTDFPQMMVKKGDLAFINHFTNLDMKGNTISIYDIKNNKEIDQINTETPSYLEVDENFLLVTNFTQNTLTVFDSNTLSKKKEIHVGKWPKKVLLVRNKH